MVAAYTRKYRELDAYELQALKEFAAAHSSKKSLTRGNRNWKEELGNTYWYNARIWRGGSFPNAGSVLHGIRNEFGPTWLFDVFKLPKE